MNVHKNARLTVHGRVLLVRRVVEEDWTVVAASEAAGVSMRTGFKWLARFRAGGERMLHDRSSAPARRPSSTPIGTVATIEELRRQRLTGPAIARRLGMPRATVGLILRRIGLGRLTALEPKLPANRYERERPGDLIHGSAIGLPVTGGARAASEAPDGKFSTSQSMMPHDWPTQKSWPMRKQTLSALSLTGPCPGSRATASLWRGS